MRIQRTALSIVPGVCLGAWLFLAVCRSVAAGDLDQVLVGQYPPYGEGRVEDIAISADYAYVAFGGAGLQILDIRNPAGPRLLGAYDAAGRVMRVAVQGGYAYLRLDNVRGLQVLDVSNPTTPRLVAIYRSDQEFNDGTDLAVSGDYACLSAAQQIELIDISNPQSPSLASISDFPSGGRSIAFAADGNIICAARSDRQLEVIDISDPTHPVLRGTCNLLANPYFGSVVVAGNYAYVGGVGLTIVDISDPSHPQPLGGIDGITSGMSSQAAVSGDLAAMGGEALTVIDVSDPENPRRTGQLPLKDSASAVALSGHYAYVGDSAVGIQVVDVANLDDPQPAGEYHYPHLGVGSAGVAVSGNHAYLPGRSGLHLISITNPAAPCYAGKYETDGCITRVTAADHFAHVLEVWWDEENRRTWSRYEIVDASNAANPQRVGYYDLDDAECDYRGPAVAGSYAYVTGLWHEGTNYYGRLQVLDISNPASPHPAGELRMPGVWDVAVSGSHACVLAGTQDGSSWASSLDVIDISDPANPHRVGAYASAEPLGGVAMSGQYAYVGAQSWSSAPELLVIDISNPKAPREVGRCRLEAGCHQVTVSGRYAFVAADYGGLLVIDVSDPTCPRRVGRWATCSQVAGAAVAGRYVYVADGEWEVFPGGRYPRGLVILDPVILNLYEPPRFESLRLDAAGFRLLLHGPTGQMMRLERSADLRYWAPFVTIPIPAGGQTLIDPAATAEPHLFYRAVSVP